MKPARSWARAAVVGVICIAATALAPQLHAQKQNSSPRLKQRVSTGSLGADHGRDGRATVLSLEDALRRAAEHNPQYRQALNRMDLETPQRREAWGAFLPSLDLRYGTGQNFRRESVAIDFFGNTLENPDLRTRISSNANQSISLSLDVLQGGARFHAVDEARARARTTRHAGRSELNRVLADVQVQFLLAQRHKGRLAVELDLLSARERDVDVQTRRFELAAVGRSDLLATQLELERQRAAVTRARGEYRKGLLALHRAIGDPEIGELDVEEQQPEVFDPAGLDLDGLVAAALRDNPKVEEGEAALAMRQAALKRQKATRWPRLSLSSNIYRSVNGEDRSALFALNPKDVYGGLSLSVAVPLFTRFQTSRAIADADVELRNANEEIARLQLEVREDIHARYVDLETAWATQQERDRQLEIASERLRIVREEYELATKSVEDLQAAVREEASALRDAVDQRFEFAAALVRLHEAAGVVAVEAGMRTGGDAEGS